MNVAFRGGDQQSTFLVASVLRFVWSIGSGFVLCMLCSVDVSGMGDDFGNVSRCHDDFVVWIDWLRFF